MAVDKARVSLRDITDGNRAAVLQMTVTEDQSNYVASVEQSFQDAIDDAPACPRFWGLYLDDEPVGFVMISDNIPDGYPEYVGPYFLWRLLIDTRWQGRGLGTTAIDLVVEYLRTRPGADILYTSYHEGPASPLPFYERYGFVRTGRISDGEEVLAYAIPPA